MKGDASRSRLWRKRTGEVPMSKGARQAAAKPHDYCELRKTPSCQFRNTGFAGVRSGWNTASYINF